MRTKHLLPLVSAGMCLLAAGAQAQWATQSIQLKPGWNAVFLEVQPEPADCDTLFAGLPVESAWAWNRSLTSAQFIQDPVNLIPGQPQWLAHLPPAHSGSGQTSLFILEANRPYLIKVAGNAAPFTWNVTGRPRVRETDWLPDSMNFVGQHVQSSGAPTFAQYFAGSSAHTGQPILRLNALGHWEEINAGAVTVNPGEACWVRCSGASTFSGPIHVDTLLAGGLEFGDTLVEQSLRIRNAGISARSFTVAPLASANAPAGTPPVAGPVPLSYRFMNLANHQDQWVPFNASISRSLAAGEEWVLEIAVRRKDMAGFGDPGNPLYQSLLVITDDAGSRRVVPVTAQPGGAATIAGGPQPQSSGISAASRVGLWVGSATLKAVSQPSNLGNPDTPLPTPAEFQFRLMVHVDGNGQSRLLQKVIQMRQEPTYKPDPEDPGRQIIDQPGRTVLLTDESLIPQFSGSAVRDGQLVGRRLSSAVFGFKSPVSLTGGGDFGAGPLAGTVIIGHDDPLNPFKHLFHPDHNNYDERYEQKLPEGRESFTVTRQIALQFTSEDPDGFRLAGWGDSHLGGTYRETILGLHRHPLHLEGTFRLQQASRVAVLNDGL